MMICASLAMIYHNYTNNSTWVESSEYLGSISHSQPNKRAEEKAQNLILKCLVRFVLVIHITNLQLKLGLGNLSSLDIAFEGKV